MMFKDRRDAGEQLGSALAAYKGRSEVIVLGLARGGVVVAAEVARLLSAPLNVIVVRKIGAPGNEELAIGAISEQGEGVFNTELLNILGVSSAYLQAETERQRHILQIRLQRYRAVCPLPDLQGKIAILVDDGLATGASMRAAIQSVRCAGVREVVVAVPVAAPEPLHRIRQEVDAVVCLDTPAFFQAVGSFYRAFGQTSDEEVIALL